MNKENFEALKNKFTDGNGKYIFDVPVMEMSDTDLRDYVDYICEKYARAVRFESRDSFKKQHEYIHLLYTIKKNRPDFQLTDEETQTACFQN